MKTLSRRETHLVSGASTNEENRKIYAEDLKLMMQGKTPDQIARLPGFRGTNQYGGYSFNFNGASVTVGPGSYKLDSNPPKSLPSLGVQITIPIQ